MKMRLIVISAFWPLFILKHGMERNKKFNNIFQSDIHPVLHHHFRFYMGIRSLPLFMLVERERAVSVCVYALGERSQAMEHNYIE